MTDDERFRYRMTVCYDGTRFCGWQVQPEQPTVQGFMEEAFARLTQQEFVKIHGSGRTDSGVHAKGQVAHFDLDKEKDPAQLLKACNSYLPRDIRVIDIQRTPLDFHARKSAVGKEYRYYITNAVTQSPFDRLHHLHVPKKLDVAAMQASANLLIGEHDFAAYSANPKRDIDGTVRTIFRFTISKIGDNISVRVCGSGFLYKMVRSLTGHLIRVGTGYEEVASTQEILDSKVRTARVESARAEGLFLWQVYYGDEDPMVE